MGPLRKPDFGANDYDLNITLKRSYQTLAPKAHGEIKLEVRDEAGRQVPVRVGIYDGTGHLPYPNKDAIEVKSEKGLARVIRPDPGLVPWPVNNTSAFYIDGSYRAKLPTGRYELVISKGPEYRIVRQQFDVKKNKAQRLNIQLERWDDLPVKGWYSGDNHIHYIRDDESDDPNLLIFTQAEDLHVASILAVGNSAGVPWPQYGWEPVLKKSDNTYSFVPGQEDPRTVRLGHTISLNLTEPIRDPQHYLIYHPVFEQARAQGGVTGYAHIIDGKNLVKGGRLGMALDVPFGLVDFAEIAQTGASGSEVWFDFLNMGFKLAPSAGSDYQSDPLLPGVERSYVHLEKPFTLKKWFEGLKRGETFVTSGPMLAFTINGKPMGSDLDLKSGDKIVIEASASINPDIDYLNSLELIEQGGVIKTIKAKRADETILTLRYETTVKQGSWFVVRATGRKPRTYLLHRFGKGPAKTAYSGAIYVYVDGKSFWKPSAVPAIVESLKEDLEQMINAPETGLGHMGWEIREPTMRLWSSQKPLLQQRIDQVIPIYDDLVKRAKAETKEQ